MSDQVIKKIYLNNEEATLQQGARLAKVVPAGTLIFLHGQLGAGKTTFVRGFLRGLGYAGKVKSPTYTMVEPYQINETEIYHFDFYRIGSAESLAYLGLSEYIHNHSICLMEWPELLPNLKPDLDCFLEIKNDFRTLQINALTKKGKILLSLY